MHGKAKLFEVVQTRSPAGGFADLLDGGQQQADQDADDRDGDQQLDNGKASAVMPHGAPPSNKGMPAGVPPGNGSSTRVLRKPPRNPPPSNGIHAVRPWQERHESRSTL